MRSLLSKSKDTLFKSRGKLLETRPIWISHRGFKKSAVENTFKAFKDAVDIGFTYLETDLRTTRDGKLVLCHDSDLKRIANRDISLLEMDSSELNDISLLDGQKILLFNSFMKTMILLYCDYCRLWPGCHFNGRFYL